jgi:hypothetical protein
LKQIVTKLISQNPDSITELPQVFGDLDAGSSIDISGLEDSYVQGKLYKICKIMRLRKTTGNELEFKKKVEKDIH